MMSEYNDILCVNDVLQDLHNQRWDPAFVFPDFTHFLPQTGHFLPTTSFAFFILFYIYAPKQCQNHPKMQKKGTNFIKKQKNY